jgi:hypothetical protein
MVIFFGEANPRPIEVRKGMKLALKSPAPGLLDSGILILG